jgi:hypothetical protein
MGRSLVWGVMLGTALLVGCLDRDIYHEQPLGIRSPKIQRPEDLPWVSGTDFVFIVDDSISMGDKQKLLTQSLIRAHGYFTRCTDPSSPNLWLPAVNGECPPGMLSSGSILSSENVSIITTSVGAGGIACSGSDLGARLIEPPTAEELRQSEDEPFGPRLSHVGEAGCGFEGPLEAMYRFLVDPEPPAGIGTKTEDGQLVTVAKEVDRTLLEQRAQTLKPLSQVVVVIITDEDDCSVNDAGDAWKMGAEPGLARGSSACAEIGNRCCRACDLAEGAPPAGCEPLSQDSVCSRAPTWAPEADPLNLRCWQQRQRFGRDWLFPIERYTEALTAPTIVTRTGQSVPNPLFEHGRTPDMVSVVLLSGVPWQDLVTPETAEDSDSMQFLTPDELDSRGAWAQILGDPNQGILPTDPHLRESVALRPGLPSADGEWDPIHGHEVVWPNEDQLQYSCIFALPEPRACDGQAACDCAAASGGQSPLCRDQHGGYDATQRFAKATPPPRLLEFARAMGARAHLGSICPRQLASPASPGFGYTDILLQAKDLSYSSAFDLSCFWPSLPLSAAGTLNCKLLELHLQSVDCTALGRTVASGPFLDAFLNEVSVPDRVGTTVCEIPPFEGDARSPGTPAHECANKLHPKLQTQGYCYVDPLLGLGQTAVVDSCPPISQRRVRVIPQNLPMPNTRTELICDYGQKP